MPVFRWLACLTLSLFVLSSASAQEKKKLLRIEDLYLMESVKSPTLFPKEEKLVYERVWIDAKTKEERHALWLVTGKRENRKPLEEGEPDGRSPVVSPDGEWIAFLSTRHVPGKSKELPFTPPYSDASVGIWMYHVKTGQVASLGGIGRVWGRVFHDGFYGRVAFSPDSKRIAFVADDGRQFREKKDYEPRVEVVEPDQGEGYTGYGPAQIYVVDIGRIPDERGLSPGTKVHRITLNPVWYGDPQWSPDGKKLVVVANKSNDRESVRYSINKNFDLYLIDVESRKQTQLTTNLGPDVSPRWSPDGREIAYLSVSRNGPHRDAFTLKVFDIRKNESRTIVAGGGVLDDRIPSFPLPDDCWEGSKTLRINVDAGTSTPYRRIDLVSDSEVKNSGAQLEKLIRLVVSTSPANPVLSERAVAKGEIIQWQNGDLQVEGIFTPPPPESFAKPPYKLIVYPHGGPHGRSAKGFDFTVQLFASRGYAVFQPNFRGSTGYGKKFIDADRLDLGGGDMRDILTGIDKLVKDGKVDPKQQFVYGISYGGFMTSWLVGHTNQFRAAVAQNAVTDMNMMYGLSDLQSWTTWELGGLPWEQPERYRKHSPITYADKVKTPTLILHARNDRRCPLPMGKAFHQALLANNVKTQLVIYPDEGHGIRSPRHREDVYRRVLDWFAKHDLHASPP
ncbi:MAG TPA: S9 family peptidase [Gemmataceae bacterium]|nr:S9 family peptidase [Gemmataceae bacterium]